MMPITKRDNGWYWGSQGPFDSREKAQEVAQAAHASGYQKAWITNPRGDGKNVKGEQKYTESNKKRYDTASEFVQKEGGDGGGGDGGSFGGGEGTVFTSENAGIFTPTHSERGKKQRKKKVTGVDRLNAFITDRSPERKMEKSFAVDLLNWVRKELKKEDEAKNPVEFDAKPNKQAAQEQLAEEARIKRLNDEGDDNTPTTAHASEAAPAGVNIQFGWDAGESQNDSLHAGGSQDTLYEDEDEKRIDRELRKEHGLFLKSILDDLDS